ncbi:unnamed protein product [Ilex paraguariensis]|uniref:Zinc-ribbon domain-containing protein n=1 Tax=Ilex paraguariensis TaxID=185542 RepID=A0ABC8T8S3_9AQUA
MSEAAQVRLVRCPKCENLLPEVTDYSVYQCGACGAVLRANVEGDEERVGGVSEKVSEKSENFDSLEKRMMNSKVLRDGSENDVNSNSYSGRAEKKEASRDGTEKYWNCSTIRGDKWVVEEDLKRNKNIGELVHAEVAKEFEGLRPENGNLYVSRRSWRMPDSRIGERGEMEGLRRAERIDEEDVRYSSSKCSEGAPLNYQLGSGYGYEGPVKNRKDKGGPNKVEYGEQDQAELLKKLDVLKNQLSRSCDVIDKPKEEVHPHRVIVHQDLYRGSENWFPDGSLGLNRVSMQHHMADENVARPSYVSPYTEASPFISKQEMPMHKFYPSMHISNPVQQFDDPLRSQMLRRAQLQAPGSFRPQPPHPFYSGHYRDNHMVHMDPFETYTHDVNHHHPSCSCFHCYNKHHQVPPLVMPTGFHGKRFSNVPNNPMLSRHEHPGAFGLQDFKHRVANPPPLTTHNPQSHTRWSEDLNSEAGGFACRRPPRVLLATGRRHCHPIAGGSPFVTCYNCFELLQLSKKVFLMEKIQKKMRCGACSTVIHYEVTNKGLLVSANAVGKESSAKVDNSSNVVKKDGYSHNHGYVNRASMNFSSDDYDNCGYDFQSMDREPVLSSAGQDISSNKSVEMKSLHSTSSSDSEDEDDLDSSVAARKNTHTTELPIKVNASAPASGSPHQIHIDYAANYPQFGKGNRDRRSAQEKMMMRKTTSCQNTMKDATLVTEIEISSNEYSNTGTSQDSSDGSRGEDQLRANKGAESFFAGIIKRSFKDSSKSSQTVEQESTHVIVNGYLIPDRLIKKAEKLAGQIHSGQYWYDSRAGFWGVMGGPCLGIVPPFIEEFNYPMPENCAGGNTGIFVNGRELHIKDLNLLGRRGLPTERDRSYIIEISGRVLDEDSGEELASLGKLAPTVEKMKHGFGMKPRVAA